MLGFSFLGVLDQVDDFSAMVEQEAAQLHHWLHVVDDRVFRAFPGPW
jgi:hypothetical protein